MEKRQNEAKKQTNSKISYHYVLNRTIFLNNDKLDTNKIQQYNHECGDRDHHKKLFFMEVKLNYMSLPI